MCKKYVSLTIYRCGNRVRSEFKFDRCRDMTAEAHVLHVVELGSRRARVVCGLFRCEACRARLSFPWPLLQDVVVP